MSSQHSAKCFPCSLFNHPNSPNKVVPTLSPPTEKGTVGGEVRGPTQTHGGGVRGPTQGLPGPVRPSACLAVRLLSAPFLPDTFRAPPSEAQWREGGASGEGKVPTAVTQDQVMSRQGRHEKCSGVGATQRLYSEDSSSAVNHFPCMAGSDGAPVLVSRGAIN